MAFRIFILLLFCSVAVSAQEVIVREEKIIRDGFHIAPVGFTSKGYTVGVGYSRPIAPALMLHGTAGYMLSSYFEQEECSASGVQITPSLLYFPDNSDNYKGICLGLELPIFYYKVSRSWWVSNTSLNEISTFEYQKYHTAKATAIQGGVAARFGFRTHKLNHKFFWQPNISGGILFQKLNGYKEQYNYSSDNLPLNESLHRQQSGMAPYFRFEIAFGLYRYKAETVKVIEM